MSARVHVTPGRIHPLWTRLKNYPTILSAHTGHLPWGRRIRPSDDPEGGLTTKIHAICDAMGNPVELDITSGQDTDISQTEPLLENINPGAFLADNPLFGKPFSSSQLSSCLT